MDYKAIQQEILKKLYVHWADGQHTTGLRYLAEEQHWEEREFHKSTEQLEHQSLIEEVASDWHFRITASGILLVEQQEIVPAELILKVGKIRTRIMDVLGQAWDADGPYSNVAVDTLMTETNTRLEQISPHVGLLEDCGYIEAVSSRSFRITQSGYENVAEWRTKVALAEEFDRIAELPPQARGRSFQKLFAQILAEHGWKQEEGVKTSNEEMDVIIHRDREYYLIECKWEKDPIEAKVIRELYGKLSNRADVRGIVASFSGFSAGTAEQVEAYVSSRVILLFGPKDIEALISHSVSFDDLLSSKYNKMVTRTKAIFS